ncbi:WxcM-like protein [Leptospira inadai serovar Lyme str. 10]|uniref:dTDP-4-dehydrorhamnose 3,5-epimerase n=1 Tax=Leptospira inadai serovar Lyme str. 10 TaxID=1049790 RepID=V6HBQ2_9LEPT|nr:dTDP-4-dehydrorhamnose 3,5-epimerase family protein [Leptospira inadai]EQA36882.1 WxcM-like protein [Leptospira inadai serovar Lyme str. 10]
MRSKIDGLVFTEIPQILDPRGAVLHVLREDSSDYSRFGECYVSEIFPGAIKAWKKHDKQIQNLALPTGRIKLVTYDDRPESASYKELQIVEIGRPDAYYRIHISPGIWYGFTCISANPAYLINCANQIHDPSESVSIPMDDPRIPYRWY